jgi:hypothetical protein
MIRDKLTKEEAEMSERARLRGAHWAAPDSGDNHQIRQARKNAQARERYARGKR